MFAYLQGRFENISPTGVIVHVGGVGYDVQISFYTFSKIQDHTEGKLYTYLHIREDAHLLFGFYDIEEKNIFLALLNVNGISTTMARIILSTLSPSEVVNLILKADVDSFQKIKGVGKKTAERLVLELKDKILKMHISEGTKETTESLSPIMIDATQALVSLGISKPVAIQAIKKAFLQVEKKDDIQSLIKESLKYV